MPAARSREQKVMLICFCGKDEASECGVLKGGERLRRVAKLVIECLADVKTVIRQCRKARSRDYGCAASVENCSTLDSDYR